MTSRIYRPIRDRGVYRAAKNKGNPNHDWALKLVKEFKTLPGMLNWVYRDRGYERPIEDMIYMNNPFLAIIPKEPENTGRYIPVPLTFKKK